MLEPRSRAIRQVMSGELEDMPPVDLLEWGFEQFAPRIALAASFGAAEGMVLLDLMVGISPSDTRVFTIDTGRLPQQTHDLIDRVRDRYNLEVEVFAPQAAPVEEMVGEHGPNLFYESASKRQLCCAIRKVEPMQRALAGLDGWVSGIRREQSAARRLVRAAEIDETNGGLVKLNPLAGWSREEVEAYVDEHQLAVNALHADGYPSVGCDPCSRAIVPGEDERAGRWWWESESDRECGIHIPIVRAVPLI